MSSHKWTSTKALTGIFLTNPVLSPLATVCKVFVPYCSLDGWVGNAGAESSNGHLHFRGQVIVKAVFAELQRINPPLPPPHPFPSHSASSRKGIPCFFVPPPCVLLCFIKPIFGNHYVRSWGFIVSEPKEMHPRSEITDIPTSPCPPLDNLGCPDPHPPP